MLREITKPWNVGPPDGQIWLYEIISRKQHDELREARWKVEKEERLAILMEARRSLDIRDWDTRTDCLDSCNPEPILEWWDPEFPEISGRGSYVVLPHGKRYDERYETV